MAQGLANRRQFCASSRQASFVKKTSLICLTFRAVSSSAQNSQQEQHRPNFPFEQQREKRSQRGPSFFQNLDSFVLSYEKEGNRRRRIGQREGELTFGTWLLSLSLSLCCLLVAMVIYDGQVHTPYPLSSGENKSCAVRGMTSKSVASYFREII